MSSNHLGTKRVCPKCDAKFYDFGVVTPIKCPKCGHSWTEGAKKKPAPVKKEVKPAAKPMRKAKDDDELLGIEGELPEIDDGDALDLEPMEDDGVELTSLEEVEEHEEEEEADPNSDDAEDEMFTEMGGDKIVDDFEEHVEDDEEDEEDDDENDEEDDDEDEDEDDDDDRPKRRRR
jgi:hypothetical protein